MNKKAFCIAIFSVILFAVLAGFVCDTMDAMSWPGENLFLLRNFGFNNGGKPVLGMVFSGNTEVLASEKGEIIFKRSANDTASKLPSPLGAWTAIDHGDGLISIYSRYDGTNDEEPVPTASVEKQEPIAQMGVSGWSSVNGFYFILYDRKDRRWVNPAMIVTPLQENALPQILSVELKDEQKQPVALGATSSRNVSQGRYSIHVNAASTAINIIGNTAATRNAQRTLLAPQRITCLVNGAEAGSLNFEAVSARDGILMVSRNGLIPAELIYGSFPAFEIAEVFLNRGQVNVEVIVQDITGNTRSLTNRLTVN